MVKSGSRAIGTIALLALLAARTSAQDVTFKVDVQLVRVLTTVKTADGAIVTSLGKNDFSIKDNGVPQEIALFERHTEQPLNIAILLDISGSTGKDIKYETESLGRFLRAFVREGNPADAAALYAFNYEVRRLRGFSRNIEAFESSMRTIKSEAGTSLDDAIYLVSEQLEKREGRKVILLITDGGDTTSTHDFHAALQAAQMADAIIYSILVVPITNDAGRNIGGEHALETLAQPLRRPLRLRPDRVRDPRSQRRHRRDQPHRGHDARSRSRRAHRHAVRRLRAARAAR
jgi:Ca-activated chloride channel family protein